MKEKKTVFKLSVRSHRYRISKNSKNVDFVILSEAKNLIITIGFTARFFG